MKIEVEEFSGTADSWDERCANYPITHLLQSYGWGEVKRTSGWTPLRLTAHDDDKKEVGCVQLLLKGPRGFRFAYIPRGPALADVGYLDPMLLSLENACRQVGAGSIIVDLPIPDLDVVFPAGWKATQPVQPCATLMVDLDTLDLMLARMRPKTRYNIRLAQKRGVTVARRYDASAVQEFYTLLVDTARRDGFGIHPIEYYEEFWHQFVTKDRAVILTAKLDAELLAALVVAMWGKQAYYLYGASASVGRQHMASYLLQWEAMKWAMERGCRSYDLWGVPPNAAPDMPEEAIEAMRVKEGGLWGVFRFKAGFGGHLHRFIAVRRELNLRGRAIALLASLRTR